MLRMFMFALALATFGYGTAQAKEIKVGMVMSFTGPIESLFHLWWMVQNLLLMKPNASGALLGGSTITLVKGDATCIDSAAAVTAAEQAVVRVLLLLLVLTVQVLLKQ